MGPTRLTRNLQLGQEARPYQDCNARFYLQPQSDIIRNKKASVQTARKPSFIVRNDQFVALNSWCSWLP
ncbi:hypothetical protein BwSH14_78140 [Bradyrhizobium ottawaense]|nr:hypothetical protein BwSH14_78140 [Bradyrhizobium ottawaense]GMO88320.1 hypothetical protein BwSG20_77840 [Bradyrhizobium ottawaense]GMO90201.1 hypothetical protein BwSG20_78600 [Bradyrhizobium ottawaense]